MSSELESIDYYDQMNKVVESMLKGSKPRQIAKQLGIRLVDVEKHIEEWQGLARNNRHIQFRAQEALAATDQHYDLIISELWESVRSADLADDLKVKNTALKMIADIEQKRIEMLQKSGLLDNQELAEQVLETERKQELLMSILRTLTSKYPESAAYVRTELSKITGQAEGTVIGIEPN